MYYIIYAIAFFLVYATYLKLWNNLKILIIIKRIYLKIVYMIFLYLYTILILNNALDLSEKVIVLMANIYLAISK